MFGGTNSRRRNRNRAGVRRERMIMLASSVFVLAALTLTGVYVKQKNDNKTDGYVVDFSSIENKADGRLEKIPDGDTLDGQVNSAVTTDDLDYDPSFKEADSNNVENSALLTDPIDGIRPEEANAEAVAEETNEAVKTQDKPAVDPAAENAAIEQAATIEGMDDTEALATNVQPSLNFTDEDSLVWPITGNVLVNYSMDKTVYFPTLQQYKYSPAIVIQAQEGEAITAAANGKVAEIYNDPEIGNAVRMELGNGYELTYGQLENVTVSEGGYVNTGDIIGNVAAPSKYYSVEGSNVYFKLTKDGNPVNPMTRLK